MVYNGEKNGNGKFDEIDLVIIPYADEISDLENVYDDEELTIPDAI